MRWRFRAPAELARFIAQKGSITVNGVSLTVNEVSDNRFGVPVQQRLSVGMHGAGQQDFRALGHGGWVSSGAGRLRRPGRSTTFLARLSPPGEAGKCRESATSRYAAHFWTG